MAAIDLEGTAFNATISLVGDTQVETYHDSITNTGFLQIPHEPLNRLLLIIWATISSSQNDVNIRVPFSLHDTAQPFPPNRQEAMTFSRGPTRINSDTNTSIRRVLEPRRHTQSANEFPVHLTLRSPSTNRAPRNQIGRILRRYRIEEFTSGRKTMVRRDGKKEGPGKTKTTVDIKGIGHVWIVDETFPSDGCARLFEVDAHDDEKVWRGGFGVGGEETSVFEGCDWVVY